MDNSSNIEDLNRQFARLAANYAKVFEETFEANINVLVSTLILILTSVAFLWVWNRRKIDKLQEKYVLITGCDSGFGSIVAQKLDAIGMNVIACCLTEKGIKDMAGKTSTKTTTLLLDVTDKSSIERCVERVKQIIPEDKGLWGLINNAGIICGSIAVHWSLPEDYRKVMDVNFFGMVDMTHALLPFIKKAKGRIVNVASILGRFSIGGPYGASKFAVETYSDGLRRCLSRYGIKVVILEPGFFKTQMVNYDNWLEGINRQWENFSPKEREEFGGQDDKQHVEKLARLMYFSPFMWFNKPAMVADTMVKGIIRARPATRYQIGLDAHLLYIPLSRMPDCIADKVFFSNY